MSTYVRPHRSARLARRVKVAGPNGAGVLEVHIGHASDGYKSDYARRPVAWLVIQSPDGTHRGTRYAGRRLASVPNEVAEIVRNLATEPDVSILDSGWLDDIAEHWPEQNRRTASRRPA